MSSFGTARMLPHRTHAVFVLFGIASPVHGMQTYVPLTNWGASLLPEVQVGRTMQRSALPGSLTVSLTQSQPSPLLFLTRFSLALQAMQAVCSAFGTSRPSHCLQPFLLSFGIEARGHVKQAVRALFVYMLPVHASQAVLSIFGT